MTAALRSGPGRPAWQRGLGVALAGLVLVGFFFVRGFPYDVLAERIRTELEPRGVLLQVASIGPAFQLAGPALEATGVRALLSNGQSFAFDRALVRPAWSLAWFTLHPALHLELESPLGSADGTLVLGDRPAWDGTVSGIDVAQLPIASALRGGGIDGVLDATADVRMSDDGPVGPVRFEVRDGSLSLPDSPVAVPFERLAGELTLGGDAWATLTSLDLSGPLASASGSGRVGRAASLERAPLDLALTLEVKPAFAGAVRSAGVRVDAEGVAKVTVTGTVASPRIR